MTKNPAVHRVAILEADRLDPVLAQQFGDYPRMFRELLARPAREHGLEFRTYHARDGDLPDGVHDADAYLITGSRQSVYEDEPWIMALGEFVRETDAAQRKVVGVCFGHQLIAHVLGGRTALAPTGWQVGVQETRILERLPWMQPPRERLRLVSSHRDQVAELPPRARVFAGSERCPIAGFVMGEHVLAIQSHPEFGKPYARALLDRRRPLIGESLYAQASASFAIPTDEDVVARWVINFLCEQ